MIMVEKNHLCGHFNISIHDTHDTIFMRVSWYLCWQLLTDILPTNKLITKVIVLFWEGLTKFTIH